MEKAIQDKAWACLPKDVRDKIKAMRKTWSGHIIVNNLNYIFGRHNLTSDTEPEELLMVERKRVQNLYHSLQSRAEDIKAKPLPKHIGLGRDCIVSERGFVNGVITELKMLFGDKGLSDKEEQVKPFNIGDKVTPIKGNPDYIGKIAEVLSVNEPFACIVFDNGEQFSYSISFLEPYTEEPEPKFKVGDKVIHNHKNKEVGIIVAYEPNEKFCYSVRFGKEYHHMAEHQLLPYTEKKNDMEGNELNLAELLKDSIGEKFFSSVHGEVTFYERSFSQEDKYHLFFEKQNGESFYTLWNGIFGRGIYPIIFPSRDLYKKYPLDAKKAWSEWAENMKPKYILQAQVRLISNDGTTIEDSEILEAEVSDISFNHAVKVVERTLEQFHNRKEGEE